MAKKKEKSAAKEEVTPVQDGEPEETETGDDQSPEAYTLTGDFTVDLNEIFKRSAVDPIPVRQRGVVIGGPDVSDNGPVTYITVDKMTSLRPALEVEPDEENKSSIKGLFIKGWRVEVPLLTCFSFCVPASLTTLSLWRCGLDRDTLEALLPLLSKAPVKTLILDDNPECAAYFHILLTEECSITNLSLRGNGITCENLPLFCSALTHNKSIIKLSLHNNKISDEGVITLAKSLRLNRTLLTLNLSNNNITDKGTKAISEVLTALTLSHEEIVARRKLVSESKAAASVDEPPTTPGGRVKERPGSNSRSGSHTALDKKGKGGASGKAGKKQDKIEKPSAKDGRKSDMGNKGSKEDKRKGGTSNSSLPQTGTTDSKSKSKTKGPAGKKYQEEKEQEPETVEFQNPLIEGNLSETDGKIVVPGNYALTCVNLNSNKIGNSGLTYLYKALHYQDNVTMRRGVKGLLRLTLKNNQLDLSTKHYVDLMEMMTRRDPFYEHPLLEEDNSNATAAT